MSIANLYSNPLKEYQNINVNNVGVGALNIGQFNIVQGTGFADFGGTTSTSVTTFNSAGVITCTNTPALNVGEFATVTFTNPNVLPDNSSLLLTPFFDGDSDNYRLTIGVLDYSDGVCTVSIINSSTFNYLGGVSIGFHYFFIKNAT